jgi:predicted CXXCH cytochrome family protein
MGSGIEAPHMKNHALRPLFVVLAVVVALLVFRQLYVPHDFGVQGGGYTYSWYRAGNVQDWQKVTVKYQGRDDCRPCHQIVFKSLNGTPHALIQCENCHGPALNHPTDPTKLTIDTTRRLCLRCHAKLQYPSSARGEIRGIDPASHNPGVQCVLCHMAHHPSLRFLQSLAPRPPQHAAQYCRTCHQEQVDKTEGMPHAIIQCEDCHGPAGNHPTDPPRLTVDKARSLCLRCHTDKARHNLGRECVTCHDPHRSSLQFVQFLP